MGECVSVVIETIASLGFRKGVQCCVYGTVALRMHVNLHSRGVQPRYELGQALGRDEWLSASPARWIIAVGLQQGDGVRSIGPVHEDFDAVGPEPRSLQTRASCEEAFELLGIGLRWIELLTEIHANSQLPALVECPICVRDCGGYIGVL